MSESRNKDQNTYYTIFKSFLAMSENSKILVLQDFYKNIHADMLWLYLDDYVDTESGNQEEQKHQIIFDSLIDLIEKELKKIEEVKREEVKKADNIAFRETILTKNGQQKEEDKIDLIRHSNLEDAFDLNHGKVISYDQFKESLVKKRFLDLNQIKINVLKYIMLSNERKL